jgi:hypothetical protein
LNRQDAKKLKARMQNAKHAIQNAKRKTETRNRGSIPMTPGNDAFSILHLELHVLHFAFFLSFLILGVLGVLAVQFD